MTFIGAFAVDADETPVPHPFQAERGLSFLKRRGEFPENQLWIWQIEAAIS